MSRYHKRMKISNQDHDVVYGHDHATGYFIQIYAPQNDTPVVEYDDLFGWNVKRRATSEQHEVATKLVKDIKDGTIVTERMDRDPENHLGSAWRKARADWLYQIKGNA